MKLSKSLENRLVIMRLGNSLDNNCKIVCGYITDLQLIEDIQKLETKADTYDSLLLQIEGDTNATSSR